MSIRALAMDAIVKRVIARSGKQDVAAEIARRRADGPPAPAAVPASVAKRFGVSETRVAGSRVVTLRRRDARPGRALVFLAGGGYAHPISSSHWKAVAQVATAAGVDAVVPLYEVIPVGDATRAQAFVAEVLAETIAERGAGAVYLAGDSAGGGLALSVLQHHPEGVRAAILLSPWLDVELAHPAAAVLQTWDAILDPDELRRWGRAWAADLPTSDPAVSPLNGRFDALPPVHVVSGGRDLLLPQALDAYRLLQRAGNTGTFTYAPDANHAVGLSRSATPEAKRVHDEVVRILRS
ncbi:alpha/beta hydrolase fold domain-containing protein [Microbacterium mangrovi]|uniref:alpha/beta hydrolase fold domain-containing protein n=1 Tax=Microbacterium mangrovi TaxID=1348253 RepID=UPI0009DF2C16|nr:alpha/beta hydrolase [Microbacterium mangrovi]